MQSTGSAAPYAVTTIVTKRFCKPDKMVAGASKAFLKQFSQKARPQMGITTVMIHNAMMDLEQQGLDLTPYKVFIGGKNIDQHKYSKYMLS